MATITEDYVSFEVAKLLSNKGFNEPTLAYAYNNGMISYYSRPKITDTLCIEAGRIPMPTIQMAMKWLREVHNFFIKIDFVVPNNVWAIITDGNAFYVIDNDNKNYDKYEQACEKAIKYCLENLI